MHQLSGQTQVLPQAQSSGMPLISAHMIFSNNLEFFKGWEGQMEENPLFKEETNIQHGCFLLIL